MAPRDLSSTQTAVSATAALHQLKERLQQDPEFAQALHAIDSTEAAAHLIAEHGIQLSPEALWRQRGTLVPDGQPTWRG